MMYIKLNNAKYSYKQHNTNYYQDPPISKVEYMTWTFDLLPVQDNVAFYSSFQLNHLIDLIQVSPKKVADHYLFLFEKYPQKLIGMEQHLQAKHDKLFKIMPEFDSKTNVCKKIKYIFRRHWHSIFPNFCIFILCNKILLNISLLEVVTNLNQIYILKELIGNLIG